MSNTDFEVYEKSEEKWDAEMIRSHLDKAVSWIWYKEKAEDWSVWRYTIVPILPEKLVRRYIIWNDDIVREILSFWFVVAHANFMPNKLFRNWLREEKYRHRKNPDKKWLAMYLKNQRDWWRNTKESRFLLKLNKFWQIEKKFQSYKTPVYIRTTTSIWNEHWATFFNNLKEFKWVVPYLVANTSKQKFINSLMRFWLKDLVAKLKALQFELENVQFEEEDEIDTSDQLRTQNAKDDLYSFLKKPFKELDVDTDNEDEDEELDLDSSLWDED